jgi:hypothetical protein
MDLIVSFLSKDQERSTNEIPDSINALAKTSNPIGNHEQLLQVLRVLVVDEVERPSLLVKVFV